MTTTPTLREAAQQFVQDYENGDLGDLKHYARSMRAALAAEQAPIDMVLHCPACGLQHIDAPERDEFHRDQDGTLLRHDEGWANPPHRSHLCHGCGHIWRPADVPTNGVAAIKTKGKADSPPAPEPTWPEWAEQILKIVREYSGYDGYDDDDGVDLPEEVREALEELTAQIERLEAKAPAPARQEWQPIETAPKGGNVIVAAPMEAGGYYVEEAWFSEDSDQWWPANVDPTDAHGSPIYPTLWQPLPAAPITAAPAEGGA